MRQISIIIILIYRKLGSVGPIQQKIKLPSPHIQVFVFLNQFSALVDELQDSLGIAELQINDVIKDIVAKRKVVSACNVSVQEDN